MSVRVGGPVITSNFTFPSTLPKVDQERFDLWFENEYQGDQKDREVVLRRFMDTSQELDLFTLPELASLPDLDIFSNVQSFKLPSGTIITSSDPDIVEPFTLQDIVNLHLWKRDAVNEDRSQAFDRIIGAAKDKSKTLLLNKLSLSSLPKEVGKLKDLEELELSRNNLTKMPKIGGLEKLKKLFLSRNQIKIFPKERQQLVNLEVLQLSHNKLTEIPDWVGEFKKLEVLMLEHNQLTSLPSSLLQLEDCRVYLVGNSFTAEAIEKIRNATSGKRNSSYVYFS